METKSYTVIGFKYDEDDMITSVQPCGSVTEVCKYLKEIYNLPEKQSRELIYTAFVKDTKLLIPINLICAVRISQHKMESEVRLHGCW